MARQHGARDFATDTVERDHRWEGLVIGGLLLGSGAAYVGNRLCNDDNIAERHCTGSTVGSGLVGAVVGSVTGGLMGARSPNGKALWDRFVCTTPLAPTSNARFHAGIAQQS
ncbi:MAG: hypothetical protein ACREBC_19540 [Pyrinomonadaceae bacterium]